MSPIERILDLARWAPSGDNTQPWRFEIVDGHHVVVHGFDTRERCVYDLDGHPSQISLGALLETLAVAASTHGLRARSVRQPEHPEARPTFDVYLEPDPGLSIDPLAEHVLNRAVQRRPMSLRRLTQQEKEGLEAALGERCRVHWIEGWRKARAAGIMFNNARLRLTLPEAYRVHRESIEWNARFSADRVPDRALGTDPLTTRLMQWVMHDWARVKFFNRWLAGTWVPRLQMELLPGMACAAHFLIMWERPPEGIDDYVDAGRRVQRFWLTATSLGLALQPEVTPLVFSRYWREGRSFSAMPGSRESAGVIARQLEQLVGTESARHAVFMGRIGKAGHPIARSTRLALSQLMLDVTRDRVF